MLYDPKWDAETKADPFTLKSLIAWLERQPRNKEFCYVDNGMCLLGQYFSAHGFKDVQVYSNATMTHEGGEHLYPAIFNRIAADCFDENYVRTFGAALTLAHKLSRGLTPQ